MRRLLPLLLVLSACTDPDVSGQVWRCASDGACLAGFACVDGACRPVAAPAPDAQPDSTARADTDAGGTACECTSGACCHECRYLPADRACETGEEFDCAGGPSCGGVVLRRPVGRYCPGNGPDCTGATVAAGPWVVSRSCPLTHVCVDGSDYCQSHAGCDASGDCVPTCDSSACQVCQGGVCQSACDAASCLACNGGGGCLSTCDANACEVCDGAGGCASRCAANALCDGNGRCVVATGCDPPCNGAACQTCSPGGACIAACRESNCETCDGAGHCRSLCDGEAERCSGGRCVPVTDPPCHDPSRSAFCEASLLSVLALTEPPDSCDLNADGAGDNAIAIAAYWFAEPEGAGLATVNAALAAMLTGGELREVLEYVELANDPLNTGSLEVLHYEVASLSASPAADLLGGAQFRVRPGSLGPTGDAVVRLPDASIADGLLVASGPRVSLRGVLGGFGIYTPVTIDGVHVIATARRHGEGIALDGGLLCGHVTTAELAAAANAFVNERCSCLGGGGALFFSSPGVLGCGTAITPQNCSTDGPEAACHAVADACFATNLFFLQLPDIDTDGDGTDDALSVGFRFEAVSAELIGIDSK